jgi:hypothetical protein
MQAGSSSSVQLSPVFPGQGVSVSVTDAEGILQASPVALNLSAFSTGRVSFRRYARERALACAPSPPRPNAPPIHMYTYEYACTRVCVCARVRACESESS